MATKAQQRKIRESHETLFEESSYVAGWSNVNRETYGSLYWSEIDLYRHPRRGYFLRQAGGAAMSVDRSWKWITEADARDFLRDHCRDGHTGYSYSDAEIERLMAGESVRPESDREGRQPIAPDWRSLGSSDAEAPQYS